jgi:ABC-type nitrate/sulfonate/bicarbonate transport system substrate-binding protein
MKGLAALLAAIQIAAGIAGCGGGGAEPGASREATVVLDFQPNAAHVGIYAALGRELYEQQGVEVDVREPSASTDGPKLLHAGRAEFAILDIHDLGLARERGLDVVGIAPIVDRPLAAVIAADRNAVLRPRDLEGETVGVTGLPSDDAVLDSVLSADGVDPAAVGRVTIGFQAVSALAAGKVSAATGFWNAEGVTLRRMGVPIREFRVDEYGAPRYPELVLCTTSGLIRNDPALVRAMVAGTERGYAVSAERPEEALGDLLEQNPGLDRAEQAAELGALDRAHAWGAAGFQPKALRAWGRWDVAHGILDSMPDLRSAFDRRFGR